MDRRRIFVRFLLSLARVIPPDPPSLSLHLALPVPKEKASFLSGVILLGEREGGISDCRPRAAQRWRRNRQVCGVSHTFMRIAF